MTLRALRKANMANHVGSGERLCEKSDIVETFAPAVSLYQA